MIYPMKNQSSFSFNYTHISPERNRARVGSLKTPHGEIETPNFIFCATKAAIKAAVPGHQLKDLGTDIILANTYHLMLQPGADIVEKMGGLHKFCGWEGPMLTDSGGFQIFSLGHGLISEEIKGRRHNAKGRKRSVVIREEGAEFKSYIDGSRQLLTPERSIEVQSKLGADLIVVLDECTPFHVDKNYTYTSMQMSHRWALRSLKEFEKRNVNKNQALYGIIQGGIYEDLRQESASFVNENEFFGHAIGGSLGGSKEQMYDIVEMTTSMLRRDRPIHLLGIGGIQDIFEGIKSGIDTFDCVHATRLARHGGALVQGQGREHINLANACHKEDPSPIEEHCPCPTCKTYSRSYLHHLLKAKEPLIFHLLGVHNIAFMNRLMKAIRKSMKEGRLEDEQRNWI